MTPGCFRASRSCYRPRSARARGQCSTAANLYEAFINEVQAQTGNKIDMAAAAILIADA